MCDGFEDAEECGRGGSGRGGTRGGREEGLVVFVFVVDDKGAVGMGHKEKGFRVGKPVDRSDAVWVDDALGGC